MNSKEALARRSPQIYAAQEYKMPARKSPSQRRDLDNSDLDVEEVYIPKRASVKKDLALEEQKNKKKQK